MKQKLTEPSARDKAIINAHKRGAGARELAKTYFLSKSRVMSILTRWNAHIRKRIFVPRGGPITREMAQRNAKIVSLHKQGYTLTQIGQMFNLSNQRASQIVNQSGVIKRTFPSRRRVKSNLPDWLRD